MRLWAMNWRMKSATAGPGQATQPSPIRKRRWRSRGSSASRSCSWRMKSTCWRSDLTGSSSRKPVRLIHAGTAVRPNTSARTPAPASATSSGIPSGSATRVSTGLPKVITRVDALAAPVRGGLVTEHPALRVAAEVDVAAGRLADAVDGVADGDDVVGEGALEPALLVLGGAEVDHPGVGAVLVQDGDRARRRRDVVDVGGEHQRRHEEHRARRRSPPRRSSGAGGRPGARATTSNGDGSSPVSSPPKRATSNAFWAAAPSRDAGLRDRVWDQRRWPDATALQS